MARPRKAELNGRDTSEVIYECAVDLMFDHGFHGTSLRDISKAVGVQISTLYYYYDSKQSLLLYIMTRTTDALAAMVRSSMKTDQSPAQQLESAITAHVEFHAIRPKEARVAETELRYLEPERRKKIISLRDEYEEIFVSVIKEGQDSGDFANVDVKIAVRAMLVALTDVAAWFQPGGRLTLDEVTATYRYLFLSGLKQF